MKRLISLLLIFAFLCPIICKAEDANQPEQLTEKKKQQKETPIVYTPNDPEWRKSTIQEAQQGNAQAQQALAKMYSKGEGVPQDFNEAAKWYKKAAEQGSAESQYYLAGAYEWGLGVPEDSNKAFKWYKKAAKQGWTPAQWNLGEMYSSGRGVAQDYNEAAKWYEKAAQEASASTQTELALMYYNGKGIPQDYEKSFQWFTKAAQQGYSKAQAVLGAMYYEGEGVPQNHLKAIKWYKKAAEQGLAEAQFYLGELYRTGTGESTKNSVSIGSVPQDYSKAAYWFKKAAKQGLAEAQLKLGVMYGTGEGVRCDHTKEMYWCKKAAKQGYAPAQFNLAAMYWTGIKVIEDYVEAYKWALLAGKNGYNPSLVFRVKNELKKQMTVSQIAQAQQLAKEFAAQKQNFSGANKTDDLKPVSNGTGFYVSANGYVVTAAHVVENAERIELFNWNNTTPAKLVYKDNSLDVAILKADKTETHFLPIISSSDIQTGDEVFTLGFPQVQIQGVEPKYTEGTINSLSGMGGNRKFFQISIPVQPGNSGSPLLNSKGQVIGVIAARLDEIETLARTGGIRQNVNYAIKSSFVLPFLDTLPEFKSQKKPMPKDKAELIVEAKKAVVIVICY